VSAPLDGVRVVDLTTGLAGPFATRLLAEAGADVLSVEPPGGDTTRAAQPAGFASWHRSKRVGVLDLTDAADLATVHDLLARADVLVHDLPVGRARDLGLDAAALAPRHRHLLVAGVPAYPSGHPLQDVDGSDAHVLATSGAMDEQQGNREGPVWIRLPFPSWGAGYLLAAGVVARLVQRAATGVVAPVATSLLQGALAPAALYWQRWERLPAPLSRHTLPRTWPDAALSIFPCADGVWLQLAGAVGGWIESPPVLEALALRDLVDLSETGVTPANRETWNAVFRDHDSSWWVRELGAVDVPVMVVRRLGECFTDEQSLANDHAVLVDDPVHGRVLQAGPPVRTAGTRVRWPAPVLPGPGTPGARGRLLEAVPEWDLRPVPAALPDLGAPAPLTGYRVLDFGSVVAGPFGAQCLGDLGADVVKVEPLAGDRGRGLTQFAGCHRGKRSLAADLKDPRVRPALDALVGSADVVLHNMRLRAAARLGLDEAGLRATNPRVVFSHVSAYGSAGPMADHPGYDPTAQALTGWEHANAGWDQPPTWLRNSVFDVHAGLASCLGAVLGLLQRERTGVPDSSATSLLAVGMTAASEVVVWPESGRVSQVAQLDAAQTGVGLTHNIRRLRDGWLMVDARDALQARAAVGWSAGVDGTTTVDAALAQLAALGVHAARVAEDQLDTFHDSATNAALGLSRTLHTAGYGRIDLVGGFWTLTGPAAAPQTETVPALGEHTVDLLREVGCSADDIDALLTEGAVAAPAVPATATR